MHRRSEWCAASLILLIPPCYLGVLHVFLPLLLLSDVSLCIPSPCWSPSGGLLSRYYSHICWLRSPGNHVIQKCIEKLPRGGAQFVLDAIAGQEAALASHCYGCRIIQRLAESRDTQQIVSSPMALIRSGCRRPQGGRNVIRAPFALADAIAALR